MTGPRGSEAWRSVEPASLLVNLVPDLWRTARAAWPLLLAVFVGGGVANFVNLALLLFFLGMSIARTVLHFLTLRYRMNGGKLEIRSGLIARRFRVIDPSRIQNLEIVQNVFHKLAGLVELRIETAGDAGAEGLLSALSVAEANRLRDQLHTSVAGPTPAAPASADELLDITPAELVGYGMSEGRIGAIILAGGLAIEVLGQFSPESVARGMQGVSPGAAIGLGLLGLALGYAVSVGRTLLRWYGFRLVRSERGLRFEGGLLTRRGVEMRLSKVQLVLLDEPLLRRAMGYGTLLAETAASGAPGEPTQPEGLLPMVAAEERPEVIRLILPNLDIDPWTDTLRPAAPKAVLRSALTGGLRWGVLALILSRWFGPAAFGLVGVGLVLGWLDGRRQAWQVTPGFVVTRTGFGRRRTWIVPRDKIQSVHRFSDPFLRRYGLARVGVWVAGGRVTLPPMQAAEADAIFEALRAHPRMQA